MEIGIQLMRKITIMVAKKRPDLLMDSGLRYSVLGYQGTGLLVKNDKARFVSININDPDLIIYSIEN
ncbi:hypothetical protein [Desulfosporosinus sp. FKA]|uniref:hypothetical protein n=1 Tax=Desulfosporosinus sp. FKA TaxID=1969834 RepID=UPI000B4A1510|nr:hypothetical protein [Desulfosporosinus sp. FKA]